MPRLPLRAFLALGLGATGLVATLVLALVVSRVTADRLSERIAGELGDLARHVAGQLDRTMFERWRDTLILAENDTLRDPKADGDQKRRVLRRARETYPDYAIIGLLSPEGRMTVTDNGRLEGLDVAHRIYFTQGRERPFVGDVHDAHLLATLQPGRDPADPPRVLDLAAPVRTPEGALAGVVVAHLDWAWSREVEASLHDQAAGGRRGLAVLVLARDGTVLLGPPALRNRTLRDLPSVAAVRRGAGGATQETWPDGRAVLTGYQPTRGYRDYPGLGWTVLVRQDAADALAPVRALQRQILLWGLAVAGAAAAAGWFAAASLARPLRRLAIAADALGRGAPLAIPASPVREAQAIGLALSAAGEALGQRAEERRQAEARQDLLIHELNHRVKNTLATVQAMARQTARGIDSVGAFTAAFEARLLAMSQTHTLLTASQWSTTDLRRILELELAPYATGRPDRVHLDGPAVALVPRMAVPVGMTVHELATNAAKYGALSIPEGRVVVRWRLADATLHLSWQESGGPPVAAPERAGFGTRLIRTSVERELSGTIALDFLPDGLLCRLTLPLEPSVASEPQAA
ncbi:sensor histidine kinase [Methylobacterium oryzisoli]|uniref:sensor histidine kinase n=1 Tax=Methylobacterium oryzisoli TaxID=3385502 RepID=UPI003892607F